MHILSNNKKLMIVLLIIWGIAILLRLTLFKTKQATVELKYPPVGMKTNNAKQKSYSSVSISDINLSLLNRPKIKYEESSKNIFKSLINPVEESRPVPPAPIPKPAPTTPPKRNPLEDEMKKIQFIGFTNDKTITKVFLSKNDNIYVAKKGENIEERFNVKEITQTEVIIALVDDPKIEFKINIKEESGQPGINYSAPPPFQPPPDYNQPPIIEEPIMEEPPPPPEEPPPPPPDIQHDSRFSREPIPPPGE